MSSLWNISKIGKAAHISRLVTSLGWSQGNGIRSPCPCRGFTVNINCQHGNANPLTALSCQWCGFSQQPWQADYLELKPYLRAGDVVTGGQVWSRAVASFKPGWWLDMLSLGTLLTYIHIITIYNVYVYVYTHTYIYIYIRYNYIYNYMYI